MDKVDPKVDEAIETLNMKDGPTRRRLLKGTGLVSATAAASALLAACGSSSSPASGSTGSTVKSIGNFPKTPAWDFWFVNHVTTNPFFVPTIFGKNDAAALLGLPQPKWGGSADSSSSDMVHYFDTAIAAKASGIATTVINSTPSDTTFTTPVAAAMSAGIPVVSYNADGPLINGVATPGTNRLCYVGQALYLSGQQLGTRIKSLAKSKGEVVIFIATPGTANIQPRSDGAKQVLEAAGFTVSQQATGALTSQETTAEKGFLLGHKSIVAACAVDAGSTELLGPQLASAGLTNIPAGGFDLTPGTLTAIQGGQLDFTINQDPYLQGFLPVLYLYLYNLTGGLVLPPDTDTGLSFVDKSSVGAYLKSSTTYEGSTGATKPTIVPRSGAIQNPVATTST
jgi:simple sugar transport system substrate-binding protein